MAKYVTKIRTESGDLQIDYNALANLPDSDKTLKVSGQFADAKATGDAINKCVPVTRTINGKPLSADIVLSPIDFGATDASHVADTNNPHKTTLAQLGVTVSAEQINNAPTQIGSMSTEITNIKTTQESAATDISSKLNKGGDTMTGNLLMSNYTVKNIAEPVEDSDVASKYYVDTVGVKAVVLFENSNINTEFSARTITLTNLSSYDEIHVECTTDLRPLNSSYGIHKAMKVVRVVSGTWFDVSAIARNTSGEVSQIFRFFTINGNSIEVTDCGVLTGTAISQINLGLIPTRIVGFKYGRQYVAPSS